MRYAFTLFRRNKHLNLPALYFPGQPAEKFFGGRTPKGYAPEIIHTDDGITGGIEDRGKLVFQFSDFFFSVQPFARILADGEAGRDIPLFVKLVGIVVPLAGDNMPGSGPVLCQGVNLCLPHLQHVDDL